jgi:phage tail-like protein
MPTRNDPLRNFRFRLEIDNITQAGFSEVTIGDTTVDMVEYREGADPPHSRKLTGLTKYGPITLKWGVTVGATGLDLFKWHKAVSDGQVTSDRKRVVIVVQDEAGQDKARFVVSEAWPSKYTPGPLSAKTADTFIEALELQNEGIERNK